MSRGVDDHFHSEREALVDAIIEDDEDSNAELEDLVLDNGEMNDDGRVS